MLTTPKKSARLLPVNYETTKTADVIYHQKQKQFIVKAVVDQMHNDKWAAVCRLFLHLTQVMASRLHHQTAQPGIRTSKLQCFLIRHQWWILCFFFPVFPPTERFPGSIIMKAMKNSGIYLTFERPSPALPVRTGMTDFQNSTTGQIGDINGEMTEICQP